MVHNLDNAQQLSFDFDEDDNDSDNLEKFEIQARTDRM